MSLKEALNIIKMEWQIMKYQLLRAKIADRLVKMSEYLCKDFESTEGKQKQREIYEIVKKGAQSAGRVTVGTRPGPVARLNLGLFRGIRRR